MPKNVQLLPETKTRYIFENTRLFLGHVAVSHLLKPLNKELNVPLINTKNKLSKSLFISCTHMKYNTTFYSSQSSTEKPGV